MKLPTHANPGLREHTSPGYVVFQTACTFFVMQCRISRWARWNIRTNCTNMHVRNTTHATYIQRTPHGHRSANGNAFERTPRGHTSDTVEYPSRLCGRDKLALPYRSSRTDNSRDTEAKLYETHPIRKVKKIMRHARTIDARTRDSGCVVLCEVAQQRSRLRTSCVSGSADAVPFDGGGKSRWSEVPPKYMNLTCLGYYCSEHGVG